MTGYMALLAWDLSLVKTKGPLTVNMKSDRIKVKGGRHEKNTVLILAMMIMLACSSCVWGFDHDRHGHGGTVIVGEWQS
jgi:hypothetical protein